MPGLPVLILTQGGINMDKNEKARLLGVEKQFNELIDRHTNLKSQLKGINPEAVPDMLRTLQACLLFIGNVDHSTGHGANSAKLRGELLNSIRDTIKPVIEKAKGIK